MEPARAAPPAGNASGASPEQRAYYSIAQAAALLGVSRATIWRNIRTGLLPARRLGHRTVRIRHEDLDLLSSQYRASGDAVEARDAAPQHTAGRSGAVALPSEVNWMELAPPNHLVQFYEADEFLVGVVAQFVATALRADGRAVVVATESHRAGIESWLRSNGLDPDALLAAERYVCLNATETLVRILDDGMPSGARFVDTVGTLIERAASGGRRVHVFGEMVALLLAEGNDAAALRLEALWNQLERTQPFVLLCGYPIAGVHGEALGQVLSEVCAQHGQILPAESYTALQDPRERLRTIATLQQRAASLESEVMRREQLEERLRQLREITAQLSRSLDAEQVLASIARAAAGLLEVPVGAVFLLDGDSEPDFRLAAAYGIDESHALALRLPRRASLAGRAIDEGRTLVVDDVQTTPGTALPALLTGETNGSEIAAPITSPGKTLGVVKAFSPKVRRFSPDDAELLSTLAAAAAVALTNAELYRGAQDAIRLRDESLSAAQQRAASLELEVMQRQQVEERLRQLREITAQLSRSLEAAQVLASIARAAAELLQVPVGAVFLFDGGDLEADFSLAAAYGIDESHAPALRLPRRASLAGRAIDEGRTLVVDDVQTTPGTALPALLTGETTGSEIAAPITSAAKALGVVKAFSPRVRRFSSDDAELLTTLAATAAVALTNAELYREAQDAIRLRDEFLSAAAHDLKNPLTAVKGLAQLLGRRVARLGLQGAGWLAEGLSSIDGTATQMAQQLEELLDLTRLELGRPLELHRVPTDCVELARRIAAEQQQVSELHQIRVDASSPVLTGDWDPVRLARVLDNLVSNAIKYSPDGGEIAVRINQQEIDAEPWAAIAVEDHGLGIPVTEQRRIFERFRRATNVAGRIGGSGVGLTSARQITEQHGGTITVESVEGAGSIFTVLLPLADAASVDNLA